LYLGGGGGLERDGEGQGWVGGRKVVGRGRLSRGWPKKPLRKLWAEV
jgi:hypothetical protein